MISVIIPVYNVENYLRQCLDSILNQTYTDFEVICVNDGSTDNSLNILNEYAQKDSRIKVISQKNKGPSKARNVGLKHANSEYICFIDSDDKIEPDFFEKLYAVKDMSDLITVKINYLNPPPDKQIWYNKFNLKKETGLYKLTPSLFTKITMAVWGKLFKKSIIDKYKIKFQNGLHEDSNFLYCYMSHIESIYYINEELYIYTVQNTSSLSNNLDHNKAHTDITNYIKLIKHLKKYVLFEKYKKSIFILFQRSISPKYFIIPNMPKILKYFHITPTGFSNKAIKKIKMEIIPERGKLKILNNDEYISKEVITPKYILLSSTNKTLDILFQTDKENTVSFILQPQPYYNFKIQEKIKEVQINGLKLNETPFKITTEKCLIQKICIPAYVPIHLHIEYEIVPEISKIRLLFSKYKYLYK